MEIKKNEKVELVKWRFTFFQIGLVTSLSFVLLAFSYTHLETMIRNYDPVVYEEDLELIASTIHKVHTPPPPVLEKTNVISDNKPILFYEEPEIIFSEKDITEFYETEFTIQVEGIEETFEVFEFYEVSEMAEFKGGDKEMYDFIRKHLVYPNMAFINDISGKVTVQFVVMPDGSLQDIEILGENRIGWGCEEAAMAVVKKMSGLWNPAKQRDKKVPVRFTLPILFEIGG